MGLRRTSWMHFSALCRRAPLSTAPAAREQPAAGPGAEPVCGPAETARPPVPAVDFGNTQEAYRSRRSWELARSLLVLSLCASPALLARHEQLLHLARKLLGQRLFNTLMKMTFYGQFVAGEDQESIRPLIQHNRAFGVGSILDYGVEEDLTPEEAERTEMESCSSALERDGCGVSKREKQFQAHRAFGDRRDGVTSARTYFYASEAKCDSHMETFLHCIEASGGASEDGFSAIKLTALGRPQFLLQFSDMLTKWRRFFHHVAAEQGKAGLAAVDTKLEVAALQESVVKMGIASRAEIEDWFTAETLGVSGTLDLLDWCSLIDSRTELSRHLVVPNMQTGRLEPLLSQFTEEEERQMTRMLQRMDVLAKKANQVGVRLMVDAEQTYFQPAISRLTLEMQRRFNVERPLIFNTFQCYLRDAYDNVILDVELARREGWCFGAKLVRGAYMAQVGYEDPINPTYEATSAVYHRCLDYVLEELKHNARAAVMVASHNEDTVRFTLRRMEELGLHPADRQVYFGQLLGMCDHISFPLGQAGFPVYKYVPYGPVMEVLPYLSRRALENSGVMKGAQRERQLLWQELKRRLCTRSLFHQPA
ncbi:proline dehydrogenase 1, mitochondrial [Bos taurus]|uniref:Proline dehydrogenase 1, mitochondrial n=1 Tax=Bos taurus TaxID=9913 RepID=PROD_BOVIN|nr:proline dehydrogenase 1, mitochondrial [Bos taurus]Q148G5.1 RecName: Full=Proline dehydrogenase 1, mitochondrial; AltName: Full=Proline oxidase; Flags: Precursor [Bos taurus]AAI18354.1 Proline dehydrogenase (oxidase) 1 [Bos taurus]